ncbi:MAG: phosphoribosyl-ATP diphosphatase [Alphaproteobacteria bacterium]|nr:phosphoribosyl-ATP diphosphatase [Alphaproteobacteria bacterium]
MTTLGAALDELARTIAARAGADPESSYTAKLLAKGVNACAKKLGEEAAETVIAAVAESDEALAGEAADLIYHLLVTLQARGVSPHAVAAALERRKGVSGIAEKASRQS